MPSPPSSPSPFPSVTRKLRFLVVAVPDCAVRSRLSPGRRSSSDRSLSRSAAGGALRRAFGALGSPRPPTISIRRDLFVVVGVAALLAGCGDDEPCGPGEEPAPGVTL